MLLDVLPLSKDLVSTIVDIMMYKAATNLEDVALELNEEEDYLVPEMLSKIPVEWEQDWWKKKLKCEILSEVIGRFMMDNE